MDMMEKERQLLTSGPVNSRRFSNNINSVHFSLPPYYLIKPQSFLNFLGSNMSKIN